MVYSLLSELSTEADPDAVAELADQLLEDAALEPESLLDATPAGQAKAALGSVALQMPEGRRDIGFSQVRRDLHNALLHDAGRAAANVLVQATQLDILDARNDLTDCFLAAHPFSRVEPQWLSEHIRDREDLRQRVIEAAQAGRHDALEVLLWAEVTGDCWADIGESASRLTRTYTTTETVVKREFGDQVEVRQSIGANFALGGLAARCADETARVAFINRMLAISADNDEAEENRWSAVTGLFNAAARMSQDQRDQTWEVMGRLARGDYQSKAFGSDAIDLLSPVQISSNVAGALQTAAVQLLGRLWDLGIDAPLQDLEGPILEGLRHRRPEVRAAAVEVLGRVEALMDSPELMRMLPHEDPQVRVAIICALGHRDPDLVVPLLPTLISDSKRQIRWAAIDIAEKTDNPSLLNELASHDPDSYVRGLARRAVDRLAHATN